MEPDVMLVHDSTCRTGEGPLWHPDAQCLYWLDIPDGTIYRLNGSSGVVTTYDAGAPVGGMTLQPNGDLLCFMARGAVRTWRDGTFQTTVIEELAEERDNRFNDVIADPAGRVFCGVMTTPKRAGRLYRLDADATLTPVLEGTGTANGMGFTADRRHMYFTDTRAYTIYRFDYDVATGAIENRRVFVTMDEGKARPDGMTVDAEGCVWSGMWEGGCLIRFDPEGREMRRIELPARNVTCPAFGGAELNELYVTTAGGHQRATLGEKAGALFRVDPGVKGVPEFRSRIAVHSV